jgi:hypothetical protein
LFDDYRRVERGRQMPFHIIHSVNGRIVDEMVFDSVTATEGVSVDTFRP